MKEQDLILENHVVNENGYFLYMTMMQAAIRMDEIGRNKNDFIDFAGEIWDSMEKNDKERLREVLISKMIRDLKDNLREVIKYSME